MLRLTQQQFREMFGNSPEKPKKYKNQKIIIDGIEFDSIREGNRYFELKLLEDLGEISDLRLQVKYQLIPKQRIGKKVVEQPVCYIADFVYKDRAGNTVVEDVKGVRTKEYIIKRKLCLWVLGIRIKEV